MIVITGAAGFIASALVARLNEENITNLILVDDFSNPEKNKNLLQLENSNNPSLQVLQKKKKKKKSMKRNIQFFSSR